MTRATNARLAGIAYLVYFAAGVAAMALTSRPHAVSVLDLITSFSALVLGVTFYALTREEDADLAMLGLACRVIEAVPGEGTIYFAVGNTIFSWLLLRGRMIPVPLAALGVVASGLLTLLIALQRGGLFGGPMSWSSPVTWAVWLPTLVFELTLATWLLTRGIAAPASRRVG